ncbi:hypothetical protein Pint_29806 [Pistacia integerrima]|uniref:Uncharacterized protein n=1 Tax=Pistacia integerrima TaxID=434235 RepID=A0ACC0WXB6_9ROSI|nr:hypothetical protein Pint_29806 [Pistacia integerrima]
MSSKQGGKAKPLKQPKADKKEYDELLIFKAGLDLFLYLYSMAYAFESAAHDLVNIQKKKEEEKALKELRAKASQKGSFGGSGLKKSGKK